MKITLLALLCLFLLSCNNNTTVIEKPANGAVVQTAFDADGYYLPVAALAYKNCRIENVLIATTDTLTASGDKKILFAQLEIVDTISGENREVVTKDFELKDKKFRAVFTDKTIGKIIFSSLLLGTYGPANDHAEENKTIVMKGTFEINGNYRIDTEFTYYAGD